MSMICALRQMSDAEIEALLAEPEKVLALLDAETDEIDLDKAWHGIHFLLTGSAWAGAPPLGYLLTGGTTVGDVDLGYGPARVLTSAQTAEFAAGLAPITIEQLNQKYDPQAMSRADIYPGMWERESRAEALEYLTEYFEQLKAFVAQASAAGKGLLIYLT